MKILNVELENLFCYSGVQSIDLTPTEDKPVVVVHGDNGYGKTRLFLAISWGLFSIRRRRKLDPLSIFNWDAMDEGKPTCSVKLTLEIDGRRLIVSRWYNRIAGTKPPRFSGEQFSCVDETTNSTVAEDEFNKLISGVFPYEVSTLFLFDGEQLTAYEALVEEDDSKALSDQLKEKLEMVLGVPVLQAARDAVVAAREKMNGIYNATLTHEAGEEATRKEFADLEASIQELRRQQIAHQTEKDKVEGELGGIRRELMGLEAAQELVRQKVGYQETLLALEQKLAEAYHRRSLAATPLYIEILRPLLQDGLATFRKRDLEARKGHNQMLKVSGQIDLINEAIKDTRCICSTPLDGPRRTYVEKRRASLEETLRGVPQGSAQPIPWGWIGDEVSPVIDQDYWSGYQSAEAETSRFLAERIDLQGKIQGIDDALLHSAQGRIRELSEQQGALSKSLEQIEAKIRELDEKLATASSRFKSLEAQVLAGRSASNAVQADRKRLAVATEAADAFEAAIEELRQLKRQEVQTAASDAFLAIRSKSDFHGLRIQKNYGLILQTTGGKDIPARSAGEGQIVALSLLSGLNQCANIRAPIIMDTPFGRLDRTHRSNVLKHLAQMGEQVVLLATDAEMDEKDMEAIRGIVAREWNIEYLGLGRSRFQGVS